jgi:glutamyl/glutaminyl-tRNA synthetase
MREHLEALDREFASLEHFDVSSAETALRRVAANRGLKAAGLIHSTRVALTGKTASPGLFEIAALLGRSRTHDRLQSAIRMSVVRKNFST